MNQKQRIFDLLAKTQGTKLSKNRKVKFALVDDLLEFSREAENLNREAFANIQEYEELEAQYQEDLRAMRMLIEAKQEEAKQLMSNVEAKFNQVKSASSDLGVEISDEAYNAYEDSLRYLEWVIEQ
jgi:hypothetical protein